MINSTKTRRLNFTGMAKLFIIATLFLFASKTTTAQQNNSKKEIEKFIQEAMDAMYNNGDIEKIKSYYHQDFILFLSDNNHLYKVSLGSKLEKVIRKNKEGFYPAKNKITIKIVDIQVHEIAATVRFSYFIEGVQTCEDFMSLYFMNDQWKIVSQTTYHIQDFEDK